MRGNAETGRRGESKFFEMGERDAQRAASDMIAAVHGADRTNRRSNGKFLRAGRLHRSAMRYASFAATGDTGDKIDISVVTFPGDGGSDADNINRWRQQIGLAPADEKRVAASIVR